MTNIAVTPFSLGGESLSLARNRLLGSLPPDAIDALAPYMKESIAAQGSVLHEAGQPLKAVHFPCGGLVSLSRTVPEGQEIETASIGREGAVGLLAALGSGMASTRAVICLPGPIVHVAAPRVAELADRSKEFRAAASRYGDILLAEVQQTAVCNSLHPIQARMCRWLLQARDRTGGDILAVTQELLSAVLGVQRTTITLVARVLQTEAILQVRRGRIHIRDAAALEEKACECYRQGRRLVEHIGREPVRQLAQQPLRLPKGSMEIQGSSPDA